MEGQRRGRTWANHGAGHEYHLTLNLLHYVSVCFTIQHCVFSFNAMHRLWFFMIHWSIWQLRAFPRRKWLFIDRAWQLYMIQTHATHRWVNWGRIQRLCRVVISEQRSHHLGGTNLHRLPGSSSCPYSPHLGVSWIFSMKLCAPFLKRRHAMPSYWTGNWEHPHPILRPRHRPLLFPPGCWTNWLKFMHQVGAERCCSS